jgi:integrase
MGRIVRHAFATTMPQEEICRPDGPDVDMKKRLLIIRDRKDPRVKDGNDQKVPLLNLTGYVAWEIFLQQRILTRGQGRVFPHNHRSVSAAFTRTCNELKIDDLHFHDLRHEGRRSRGPVCHIPVALITSVMPPLVQIVSARADMRGPILLRRR